MYLLGIDGGQTSTKSCLYDQETGTCLMASGPSIDHMLTLKGQIKSKQGIQQSLQRLLEQVMVPKSVEMAFVSISGLRKEHEEMIRSWIGECLDVKRVLMEGDARANLAGATSGANDGVLIIAGGGSLGYYSDGEREFVAGGYGHILGDEGSAYWIGLQAIKESIRYSDGRGQFTIMHDRILHHFGETSFWAVKNRVHAETMQRSEIAGLAVLVEKAADDGDGVAQSVLLRAGEELGELAVSVLRQLENDPRPSHLRKVFPTGGVFRSTRWVKRSTVDSIRSYDPSVEICRPRYPPVVGALILSAQLLGRQLNFEKITEALDGGDQ